MTLLLEALEATDKEHAELKGFESLIRAHAVESLNDFVTCDRSWLKSPAVQVVMQRTVTQLVSNRAYLLHAVLAVSAAHLAFYKPSESRSYWMASGAHFQHSIILHAERMQAKINEQDVDALFFANLIHSILAFLYSPLPLSHSQKDSLTGWIMSMRGTHLLFTMPAAVEHLSQGCWATVVEEHKTWHRQARLAAACASSSRTSNATAALLQYCNRVPGPERESYLERVQTLRMMELETATSQSIGGLASFITEAPREYILQLKAQDEVALLLLLRWCGLFSRIDQWWISRSAKSEYGRLYAHLSRNGSEEIQALLALM
ncbi:hypothetical protein M409DRAFT_16346 [Zasmidium cellare ATCC 36951]|uniref:Transcription factor domain-containing protein n=1 Tax=Zasmidium cellare ATCC 36951 TaxID=1080233 RepID=A0A6A6D762_ZASCE|nr:uncharacterized protein M409DRAFT_16346 [Zasmidium cellare ATCC 36951]KAF2174072.1 hypothetical protein M409DRAFT_16346 [Zasmidium cellare ATCC 36951]